MSTRLSPDFRRPIVDDKQKQELASMAASHGLTSFLGYVFFYELQGNLATLDVRHVLTGESVKTFSLNTRK